MKKLSVFAVVLLAFCLWVVPSMADDLTDVLTSGTLVFGTSPEYVPFVFYGDNDELTGIDVALIQEVGRRMGVQVRSVNMAFDGLIDSLNVGQVDVIGGGLSKTDERAQVIDFSRVYYKGDAQLIAKASRPHPDNVDLMSLRGSRVGVQRGTSFDQWVKSNLVNAGYVGTRDVYSYSKVADAVEALDRGEVDFVLMDQDVYEDKYRDSGKYQLYYNGFAQENYAFGSRKNSSLTNVINGHLADMVKDGTAQAIANRFFSMNFNESTASIDRPSQIITPMPQPATCVNSMSFVGDVTITDGHQVNPNERFVKTWRVYNNGSCTWDSTYTFGFVSGDRMNGRNVNVPMRVQPGQTVDISVEMTAPAAEGTYRGYWQMRSPQGTNFGQTVWVKVRVRNGGNPTPTPKPRPTATPYPTSWPGPAIDGFYADAYTGSEGNIPTVYWNTRNAATIIVSIDGVQVYNGSENSGSGRWSQLGVAGDHYVELLARNVTDDSTAGFSYTTTSSQTDPHIDGPSVDYFYPDFYAGNSGDVPNVYWSCPRAQRVEITVDGTLVYSGDAETGSGRWDALGVVGNHYVEILARNVTDDAYSSFQYTTNAPLMPDYGYDSAPAPDPVYVDPVLPPEPEPAPFIDPVLPPSEPEPEPQPIVPVLPPTPTPEPEPAGAPMFIGGVPSPGQ